MMPRTRCFSSSRTCSTAICSEEADTVIVVTSEGLIAISLRNSNWPGLTMTGGEVQSANPLTVILTFQGTSLRQGCSLCGLGFDGDKLVAQLLGLPLDFCFQPFLSLAVSGGPDGFVVFDLVLDHGVKDQSDFGR